MAFQALARGFLARCEFRRRLAVKRAREAAAMCIIAPWARTALERCRFLTLRFFLSHTPAALNNRGYKVPSVYSQVPLVTTGDSGVTITLVRVKCPVINDSGP